MTARYLRYRDDFIRRLSKMEVSLSYWAKQQWGIEVDEPNPQLIPIQMRLLHLQSTQRPDGSWADPLGDEYATARLTLSNALLSYYLATDPLPMVHDALNWVAEWFSASLWHSRDDSLIYFQYNYVARVMGLLDSTPMMNFLVVDHQGVHLLDGYSESQATFDLEFTFHYLRLRLLDSPKPTRELKLIAEFIAPHLGLRVSDPKTGQYKDPWRILHFPPLNLDYMDVFAWLIQAGVGIDEFRLLEIFSELHRFFMHPSNIPSRLDSRHPRLDANWLEFRWLVIWGEIEQMMKPTSRPRKQKALHE